MPYQDKSNVKRWRAAARDLRCRGNAWFMPYDTIKSRDRDRPHPATFPPRLPEQCLLLHGADRLRLVLDPFAGLGAHGGGLRAAGVNFIGIDLDEVYLNEAVARTKAAGRACRCRRIRERPRVPVPRDLLAILRRFCMIRVTDERWLLALLCAPAGRASWPPRRRQPCHARPRPRHPRR